MWFNRGLNWLYGFNHAESVACFRRAAESDPDCAMAHWGSPLRKALTTIKNGPTTVSVSYLRRSTSVTTWRGMHRV
ncbi:MAG: hypothetical protein CM1200mP27_03370 [Chloroflexota bacterium]|nr:MAG: hypothetical protein CM1200mP27_03370 [Chloroflexota bacterium]